MIEGLGWMGALRQERRDANPKQAEGSFAQWLEAEAAEIAERRLADNDPEATASEGSAIEIELLFRRGERPAEAVSVPWRLMAGARLSQRPSTFLLPQLQPQPPGIPPGLVAKDSSVVSAQAAAPASAPSAAAQGTRPAPLQTIDAGIRRSPIDTSDGVTAIPARRMDAGYWAERLLRWIEGQGRAPELWIRDYGLDEHAAERMAESMRAFAREHGIRLERVVVNAREIWRTPQQRQEND